MTRKCKKCNKIKPLIDFGFSNKKKGWRRHECKECRRNYHQNYYVNNKDYLLTRSKEYREIYKYDEIRHEISLEKKRKAYQVRTDKLLKEALYEYGGKCACCGESEPLFLSFDHILENGAEMRKIHGSGVDFYHWLKKNNYPRDTIQLLCLNCNLGKALNDGVCPHKKLLR